MRCGWIPSLTLIDFIMESSVFKPSGTLQYHTFSSEIKLFTSLATEKDNLTLDLSVRGNFYCFYGTSGRFWHSKYFRVRLVAGKEPGNFLFSSKCSSPRGVALEIF